MSDRRPGAPRSEASRIAILRAAAALVEESGYDAITFEGIAARAGVGKQTIYRWYASKSALIVECLLEGLLIADELPLRDTGDVRADLREWLIDVFAFVDRDNNTHLLSSLLSAATRDPAVAVTVGERLGAMGPTIMDRLERSRSSGELPEDFAPEVFLQAMFGAIVVRALTGMPFEPADSRALADFLLG